MITDKQIEEATIAYSEKLSNGKCYRDLELGFKAGAHWAIEQFLKGLWHDAEEEQPNYTEDVIELFSDNEDAAIIKINKNHLIWLKRINNKSKCKKWAYIFDLLPKLKGGEK